MDREKSSGLANRFTKSDHFSSISVGTGDIGQPGGNSGGTFSEGFSHQELHLRKFGGGGGAALGYAARPCIPSSSRPSPSTAQHSTAG